MQGANGPTGASAAVQGDRPTTHSHAPHRRKIGTGQDCLRHLRPPPYPAACAAGSVTMVSQKSSMAATTLRNSTMSMGLVMKQLACRL